MMILDSLNTALFKRLPLFVFTFTVVLLFLPAIAGAQSNKDCFACHEDKSLEGTRSGRTISVYVNAKTLRMSAHNDVECVGCHADLAGAEFPHDENVKPVDCSNCHSDVASIEEKSLHGKAVKRGDKLAPRCKTCHGTHEIIKVKDPASQVYPARIPFLCGSCHQEGSPVTKQRKIHQDNILENYSESIHGEGLLRKGLIVAATCVSCHTPHSILPHTDPASSINRKNISSTCVKCHVQIENVHRKIIKGELWEKQSHILPSCPDCHQPHKARRVFYDLGMSNKDCLRCHENSNLKASKDGRSLYVNAGHLPSSRHAKIACSQCHSTVNASRIRPCETISQKVDCASCHAEVGQQYVLSTHGKLFADNDQNAPTCKECHGTHQILGRQDPFSPIFPTNIPKLCAACHREGEQAAVRYRGEQKDIIKHYTESIHGKGLMKSGLTVTATCTNCHTAHRELPHSDSQSSVNPKNVAKTCGACHHGIEDKYERSVHFTMRGRTDRKLPTCNDCHSAHTIRRADETGFKLHIMDQCGKCHAEIAKTYFDTYHGKVSQLGYTKTAKCYDCHGAHDILPIGDPKSRLSFTNVVETCKQCHPGATRRFAGYLTHATHHDPKKYPFLFWAFWGMTTLLLVTFVAGGLHTLLWLPRALKMRKEIKAEEAAAEEEERKQSTATDERNAAEMHP